MVKLECESRCIWFQNPWGSITVSKEHNQAPLGAGTCPPSPPAPLEVSSREDPDLVTTKYLPRESPMAMDGGALGTEPPGEREAARHRSFRPHTDRARQRKALKTCVIVPSARALHWHCRGYSCCLQCFTDEQPSSPRPAYTSSPATNQDQLLAHFCSASPTLICTTSGITEFTLPLPSSAEWHLWSSEQTNNAVLFSDTSKHIKPFTAHNNCER